MARGIRLRCWAGHRSVCNETVRNHRNHLPIRALTHQHIVIAPHCTGNEIDDGANARNRLEILVNYEPPVSNKVDFRLHDPHELVGLSAHEVRQHDKAAT